RDGIFSADFLLQTCITDETEDAEEYVEETIQDAIMIAATKTSCIWSYSQGIGYIIMPKFWRCLAINIVDALANSSSVNMRY
nr:hypothetical protein [Tanacetum cinerariifolium]